MGVQKVSKFGLGWTGGREGRNRGLHQSALLSDWSGDEEAFSSDSLVSLILEGHYPSPCGRRLYQRICSVFSMYSPARISRAGEWALEACLWCAQTPLPGISWTLSTPYTLHLSHLPLCPAFHLLFPSLSWSSPLVLTLIFCSDWTVVILWWTPSKEGFGSLPLAGVGSWWVLRSSEKKSLPKSYWASGLSWATVILNTFNALSSPFIVNKWLNNIQKNQDHDI